ncbi:MAG: hypothetical protein COT45_06365 [bacterium (Candidatus Stahlbacteria) CG08_land_8_20_14_0_20_40_26]|nr:MAG: hypothetical protein COT45_06365 [bacterium (Candidatus Stahlbacteria) CG08_land_8_20_14_0_20_40_26]
MKILKSEDIKRILSLARWTLRENEEYLNSLNVFPVPDGDTGTNMYLTVNSGWYAVEADTDGTLKNVLRVFSREAVMGARGNSGIILAQFFAGVKDITDTEEYIPLSLIPSLLDHATKEAIYSIGNPVRGTILTVMEEVRDAVKSRSFKTMEELAKFMVRIGYSALKKTPDLLPILKEAGVVDAGAQGFCFILDAFNAYLTDKKPKIIDMVEVDKRGEVWHTRSFNRFCVNIAIDTCSSKIKEKLKNLGDSLIVGHEENLVKVHIHTNNPPLIVDTCKKEGNIIRVQINDTEKEQKLFLGEEKEGLSVIAYSNGDGLKDIMMSMGASLVLSGEQNPSTGEIVSAVERIGKKAIILPNHSNVIPAAMKAKELANIQCGVIETKSVPEGISALLAFREDGDLEEVMRDMESASVNVLSGEIKWAVRNAKIGGKIIKKGDTLCLKNKKLISVSPDPDSCLIESIYNLIQGHSLITIYYGKSLEDKNHDSLLNQIKKRFPSLDIQMYYGGMTNAYYLFSLE